MIDFFPLDMNLFYKFKVNQSMGSHGGITRSDALPSGIENLNFMSETQLFGNHRKITFSCKLALFLSDNSFNWVHSSDEQGMEGKATLLTNQIDPTF